MNKLFYVVLLTFLCTLVTCSPTWKRPAINGTLNKPIKAYVCVDVPEAQFEAVREAVVAWDRSIGAWKQLITVKERWSPGCAYWVHEVTIPFSEDTTALAWTNEVGGNEISLIKGRYEFDTLGIMLHELGHAFGAQHIYGTLMNPTWSRHYFVCPDIQTVAQVAAWNHVNIGILTWCSV